MTEAAVSVTEVRGWVRKRQAAHKERGETLGNFYFALLFIAIVGGMLHRQLAVVFWPSVPNASQLAGVSIIVALIGGLYIALRRLGPLALSRPASSWLLMAPVSRRVLLLPSLGAAMAIAAMTGALGALAIMGHVLARPLAEQVVALPLLGALAANVLLLIALAAQADRWWSGLSDTIAYLLLAAGLAGLVVDSAVHAPRAPAGWPPAGSVLPVVGALALIVLIFFALAVRTLGRTPNDRILEAAKTAGTLADSAFGVEPSFVTDMLERRYWARRKLRSMRLWRRVPVLTAQDLLLLRRRPRRLLWLAGGAALPSLFVSAPGWVLAIAVVLGGLFAGGVTTSNVRTDTGNPWMLRMLGISSRDSVLQRCYVPVALATIWYTAALSLLQILGELPAGPWWALGIVLGPVGGVAAVRKARTGFVNNSILPFDTPMGSFSPGPLIASLAGVDVLLLGVPTIVLIALGNPLDLTGVIIQATLSVLAVRAYLAGTTAKDRVELSTH
ncbi:DUF6297 family protein [Winogradskya humida]|uniref:ABC-2 type transport system permease protein n=1 Tax=Winogradskya humida TaxID=113566 RepID=A0ABQ3ZWJ0_9ACTN|nr:DUF6297 family protein [Actinoplanes humidus]GIE22902.1 hypothetical protein Ahu01nite_060040 [Actinoplanes humidus]